MPILARNVAQNCGRAAAAQADSHPSLRNPVGRGSECGKGASEPREENPSRTVSDAKGPSPPRVQSVRWGDTTQLAEALAHFDGFGPDVVLA